ncbi:hypothetical protein cyc_03705 [Cyclospora cayetanensis]|uniref:Uncharacterized protein n=1 Tax=Cyclospora cayetanensis TaxID=88456 RepID=A0A1D3CSX5_9EIME|nr:hypothetical protein cyc_03705 [Cyclospora cayetanensis]
MASRSLVGSPASSFDGCLLLQALNDALSRMSAAAFVRRESAQKILTIARRELLRLMVQRSACLPSLVVFSPLQIYHHVDQGTSAEAENQDCTNNTWLFVLRDPLIGVLPGNPSGGSSSTGAAAAASRGKALQQQAESVLQELRRLQLQPQRDEQQPMLHTTEEDSPGAAAVLLLLPFWPLP